MDNKQKILETAVTLFSGKTYEGIGIMQVAQDSGISKPTLYHYFGSKKGLMEAILEKWGNHYLERLRESSVYQGDVKATLTIVASVQLKFALDYTDFYLLFKSMSMMPDGSDSHQLVKTYTQREYDLIREMFFKISADHGNIGERHKVYAATFIGLVTTYVNLYLRGATYSEEDLLYRIIHQFMHGIFS